MIPKRIYAAWCGDDPLPSVHCYIQSWRKRFPDYEIHLLDDDDIPSSRCTRAMRDRGIIVNSAQYACWAKLYETGGIYLDLDVDVLRDFGDLLAYDAFIGVENDGPNCIWAACGVLGAVAGHPFIRECLDYMDSLDYDHTAVENELGPRMFTNLLAKHGWKRTDADATIAGVRLLNSKRFYPYSWHDKGAFDPKCVTTDTYGVHHWAYSWKHKTSVVIPCYNQGQFLAEAIESVLAQTEPPIEIIVVDDASTDDTAKVAKRYPVTLVRQRKNGGVSAARNAGIAKATGKNIVCLDADDRLRPEFIEKLAGLADIVSCDLKSFGASGGGWKLPMSNPAIEHFIAANQVISGSLFRKSFWTKVGGYDESMRDGLEDWDFWTRCVAVGARVHIIHETLFDYRTYAKDGRTLNSNSFTNIQANYAELLVRVRAKWAALGIVTNPVRVPPLHYPIKLGITVHHNGIVYAHGDRIDRPTAVMLKKAGLLKDERIV